jgi:hypothetical protein
MECTVFACVVAGMYVSGDFGLADNGDFTRNNRWITSGPMGFAVNWPEKNTPDWDRRFFRYWLPDWQLHWKRTRPRTSAIVFWLPGALLNCLFYSRQVLSLPVLSIPARAAVCAFVLLVLVWARSAPRPEQRFGLTLIMGLPIALLLTTRDCAAYLNTFYQETASLLFALAFIASLVYLRRAPRSHVRWVICGLSLTLLCTAKASCFHWAALGTGFVLALRTGSKVKLRAVLTAGVWAAALAAASLKFTDPGNGSTTSYNSLFTGILPFSACPQRHLDRLGLSDALCCIGHSAFTPVGTAFLQRHPRDEHHQGALNVILHEPAVLARAVFYVATQMGDLSLDYLGHYAPTDPRSTSERLVPAAEGVRVWVPSRDSFLNVWSWAQFHAFPRGWLLLGSLFLLGTLAISGLRRAGLEGEASLVVLVAVVACVMEMTVAIVGDGRQELIKHLFLANVLFSIALIATIARLGLRIPGPGGRKFVSDRLRRG